MSPDTRILEEFDLQPDPRILPMLGEINLPQWRCIAELVDNGVDGFLAATRAGHPIPSPEVHVSVPTVDSASAKVTVRDNGPGMDLETLEKAVRAGWTGNDPISNLGMFGMGFNIATARLGTTTEVWTTRAGDTEWYGLQIDFERLMRQRHYRTPRLSRPKFDPHESGTEVSVVRIKPEQRQFLTKTANLSRLRKELSRVYSAILRPHGVPLSFRLMLNGTLVRGRGHCIWGGDGNQQRQVQTSRYGIVDAFQPIDVHLDDRPFCTHCWQWLPHHERNCPACGSPDDVLVRQRRVYGWLGVQRYLHSTEYGLDLLRHGRKIETNNKDLFFWSDGDAIEPEYPIDDPRNRGRVVGEIHIDHCRVTYTKDRFDRNDPAWEEMVNIVRGDGPLRPDKAEGLGFGANNSPLFRLFQAFRRSSPKPKVAGCYAKLLIVPDNDRSEEMAKRFFAGESEFQTDSKWWELVEEADRQLLTPSGTPTPSSPPPQGFENFGGAERSDPEASGTTTAADTPPPPRTPISSLSGEYRDDGTGLRWEVAAYQVEESDAALGSATRPWALRATAAGVHEFFVNTAHSVFRSATLTPQDALLAELAWSAMDFQRGTTSSATFSGVLASLRERYAVASKLDPVMLSGEAISTLGAVARSLSGHTRPEDGRALFEELSPAEQEAVHQKMASKFVPNAQQAIDDGRFLEFAPRKTLLRFFETHPDLFFDGRYWDVPFSTLNYGIPSATEEAQAQIVRYYASLLSDVIWLAEQDATELADASRPRLLRAALALDLISGDAAREDGA